MTLYLSVRFNIAAFMVKCFFANLKLTVDLVARSTRAVFFFYPYESSFDLCIHVYLSC